MRAHKEASLPKQQNREPLICVVMPFSVKPGAHSFKIKGAIHFDASFTAVLESKEARSNLKKVSVTSENLSTHHSLLEMRHFIHCCRNQQGIASYSEGQMCRSCQSEKEVLNLRDNG